jgi:cell division protein ZapA
MNKNIASTLTLEVFGKNYQIKCDESEVQSWQRAAQYLEDQMKAMRESNNILSSDKIMIAASLHIANQFLILENKLHQQNQSMQQRLSDLQMKVEDALAYSQMELQPVE